MVDALQSALSGRDARLQTEDVISLALCLLGLIAYLELAIQLFLQKAWLVYMAATLPIAGAASVTGAGKAVFDAMLRLAVTVLLFKPVAALLFAVGFWQIREFNSGADVVTTVLVMAAPAFCMPVLINLIGNTAVAFAGTPMLRGTMRLGRTGSRLTTRGISDFVGGFREGASRGRGDSDESGTRAEARASAAPTTPQTPSTSAAAASTKAGAAPAPAPGGSGNPSARTAAAATTSSPGASAGGGASRAGGSGAAAAGTGPAAAGGRTAHSSAPGSAPRTTGSSGSGAATGVGPAAGSANRAGGRSGNSAPDPGPGPGSTADPAPPRRPGRRGSPPHDVTFTRIT
ncbi:hypothetical protein [Nocardia wallacei]|uniref:hypothetical protein n=1 Tax=Nocardia wallacei TaxID=480035 RepID=UPI002457FCD6|nr:hypothetical protein [Nocardia wallacei]